jgi:hypothetical protein
MIVMTKPPCAGMLAAAAAAIDSHASYPEVLHQLWHSNKGHTTCAGSAVITCHKHGQRGKLTHACRVDVCWGLGLGACADVCHQTGCVAIHFYVQVHIWHWL